MTSQTPDAKALATGLLAVAAVVLAIALGSQGFQDFDPALTGYAIGTMLAAFAVGYRFMVWAQRPPSRMYFKRGLQLLFRRAASTTLNTQHANRADASASERARVRLPHGVGTLGFALTRNFVAQEFIRRRGGFRWIMHLCLSGGCTLAFAITFPLVFGWIHFESFAGNAEMYRVKMFGVAVDSFSVHSLKALMMFNALNISAVLVLVGLIMATWRRLTDAGERATQTFFEDILPLLLIFAVTATGLALTVSYKFLAGRGHGLWAIVHMASVVALLIYIPYGKLFHMFQRSCALAVSRYKKVGATGARAHCRSCGDDFASQMHVDDLKVVLDQLGFDFRFATPRGRIHYQDICPACRRRLLALNQGRSVGR
jgi:NNP family nitrate/nitrite transporter-like MFS transporter